MVVAVAFGIWLAHAAGVHALVTALPLLLFAWAGIAFIAWGSLRTARRLARHGSQRTAHPSVWPCGPIASA